MSNEPQYPCSNGFCWLRAEPLVGQHTNGPCNCLRDIPLALQQAVKRKFTHQREEISRLTAELAAANQRADERTDVARELQRLLWIASPVDGTWVKKRWPWLAEETT